MGGGGGPALAAAVLTKARNLLPDCLVLHFAAAELEESRGETDAARSIFEEQVQVCTIFSNRPCRSSARPSNKPCVSLSNLQARYSQQGTRERVIDRVLSLVKLNVALSCL